MCQNDKGNYTTNSAYMSNLNAVLSSLPTGLSSTGFYNASVGQNPDRANAAVLCRGDVELDECRQCLRDITAKLLKSCPNQKQAVEWEDHCMLRYSNEMMFGVLATYPGLWMWNLKNATSTVRFKEDLRTLIDGLRIKAAAGGDTRKVAAGNITAPDFQTIYSLVQCSPDLSQKDCNLCLSTAAADIPRCCDSKIGARVLLQSCNLRYETYPFFNETVLQQLEPVPVPPPVPVPGSPISRSPPPSPPPAPPPAPPAPGNNDDDSSARTVVIIAVSIAACVIVVVALVGICLRKKIKRRPTENPENKAVDEITTVESLQYGYSTIKAATNDFSDHNKLGQGGFGDVYKGKLPNDQEIAVKRLSKNSGQGDVEFKNEILLLAKLQHRNLVRLLGFSIQGTEKLLVYEFVRNGSLDLCMSDPTKRSCLDWDKRYKIIGGVARGLVYLHEDSQLRIIHRDLKPANVLLDREMNPKIADFGMARLFEQDETQGNTSRIVGTYGYMSPEYAMHGNFSIKSDVFSFGVLVLEIMSGQKNRSIRIGDNVEDLLTFTWKNWREGTTENMIDPVLRAAGTDSLRDMIKCIHIGLLCVQENAAKRPTMASILLMLSSSTMTMPVPSEPAFFMTSTFGQDTSLSHNYDDSNSSDAGRGFKTRTMISEGLSINDVTSTDLYPR
ncbi:hypothetical protein ABFX02_08G092600 [Erythranthe guttata]